MQPAAVGAALTYSVYLWHVDFLKAIDGPPMALLVTVAVASAVYVSVERPAFRLVVAPRGIPAPSTSVSIAVTEG